MDLRQAHAMASAMQANIDRITAPMTSEPQAAAMERCDRRTAGRLHEPHGGCPGVTKETQPTWAWCRACSSALYAKCAKHEEPQAALTDDEVEQYEHLLLRHGERDGFSWHDVGFLLGLVHERNVALDAAREALAEQERLTNVAAERMRIAEAKWDYEQEIRTLTDAQTRRHVEKLIEQRDAARAEAAALRSIEQAARRYVECAEVADECSCDDCGHSAADALVALNAALASGPALEVE